VIKILWNQCEAETKRPATGLNYQMAQYQGAPVLETVQCESVGGERTFSDGAKAIMCDKHWAMCTGIVDKDGAKHMKPYDAHSMEQSI
jgi:hypothetical protein